VSFSAARRRSSTPGPEGALRFFSSALPEPLRGPEDVKDFIATYLAAFPDARMTVTMQLAEGIWSRLVGSGAERTRAT
jgi:hypothetical protein